MENWREIPGFEGFYEVSDFGRIRSIERVVSNGSGVRKVKAKIRSLTPSGEAGYLGTLLSVKNKKTWVKAHIAVLKAFVGPRPHGLDGCHNDGDLTNNRLTNLRWDTKRANNADKIAHGTHQAGSKNGASKLVDEDVRQIRADLNAGVTQSALARKYGVSVTAIWQIKHGVKWTHIN